MLDILDTLEGLGIHVINGAHRLAAGLSMGHTVCAKVDGGGYCVFACKPTGELVAYSSVEPAGIEAGIVICYADSGARIRELFASTGQARFVLSPSVKLHTDDRTFNGLAQSFARINNARKRDPFSPAIRSVGEKARLRSQRQQAMKRIK